MGPKLPPPGSRKRLAVLGHCILNQNARAPGIAVHKGAVMPLVKILEDAKYELLQLPCPEVSFNGVQRWWFVYENYDSVGYRHHCARLARVAALQVKSYYERGYDITLIGLGISPSCGVRMRQTNKAWKGKPFDVGDRASIGPGSGVWIEELESAFDKEGIPFRVTDLPPVLLYLPKRVPEAPAYPGNEEEAWREIKGFVEARV